MRGEEEVKIELKKLHRELRELKELRGGERGDRKKRGPKKRGIMYYAVIIMCMNVLWTV